MAEETAPELNAEEKEIEEEEEKEKKKVSPVVLVGLAILGVTLLLFAGLVVLGFLSPGTLHVFRDASIVFLVMLIFFSVLLVIYLLAVLVLAVNRVSDRLDDLLQRGGTILDQVKGTATTVKGTAGFVGERIAAPFIRVASWASGVGKGVFTFFRGQKRTGGSS